MFRKCLIFADTSADLVNIVLRYQVRTRNLILYALFNYFFPVGEQSSEGMPQNANEQNLLVVFGASVSNNFDCISRDLLVMISTFTDFKNLVKYFAKLL